MRSINIWRATRWASVAQLPNARLNCPQDDQSSEVIDQLVTRLMEWYKAWSPPQEWVTLVEVFSKLTHSSLGATVFSAYTLNFQTRLFSALPASFTEAFKSLCASLLSPPDGAEDGHPKRWNASSNSTVWKNFELLGLIDRYESVIASVGYEFIEQHVHETCTGEWAKPVLEDLRVWMSDNVVPWMVHVYARGAGSRACIRSRQLVLTD